MADYVNGGVKRTDEGVMYVYHLVPGTTLPTGTLRANGALPRTRALRMTPANEVLVSFV